MKRESILRSFTISACAATLLAACAVGTSTKDNSMSETKAITSSTHLDSTTYCLGRFLIDLPAGSESTGGNYKYDFTKIEPLVKESLEKFQTETSDLEKERRHIKHEKDPSLLLAIQRPSATAVSIVYWEDSHTIGLVNVDGYKWIDGYRYLIKDEVDDDKQELGMNSMLNILSRIRARADDDIPKDPGFCFKGGFIANDEWENEEAAMDFTVPDYPDAMISVTIFPLATRKHDKPLLERMGGILQSLGGMAAGVHVLRKGERDFQGIQGQEYLATAPNEGGTRGHTFTWETQGDGTLDTPFVSIEMTSSHNDAKGNPRQTRLTDAEAIKLWGRVVGSFRLRPVDGPAAKTSAAEPPRKPLGSLAVTGRLCEQTGLWQCDTASAVPGTARRFIQAGERMPHALAYTKPTTWQKFKGEQPSATVATRWELVSYEAPDSPIPAAAAMGRTSRNLPSAGNADGGNDTTNASTS